MRVNVTISSEVTWHFLFGVCQYFLPSNIKKARGSLAGDVCCLFTVCRLFLGSSGVPEKGGGVRGEEPHEPVERLHDRRPEPLHVSWEERQTGGNAGRRLCRPTRASPHYPSGPAVDGEHQHQNLMNINEVS